MRPRREPVFNVPVVVLGMLALLVAIQVVRVSVSSDTDLVILTRLAFVPIRLTAPFDSAGVAAHLATWSASADAAETTRAGLAGYFLTAVHTPVVPTLLTYALLHGGWSHLLLNGVWLLAFGTPTARRFGGLRFATFMAVAAVAGALLHWALFPFGAEPLIGASASVSGCMGAALRFAFQPPRQIEGSGDLQPALPLRAVLVDRRARSFLLVWFVSNVLFGVGSVSFGLSDQPVAWQAHIGGFLAGLLLFPLFDPAAPAIPATEPRDDADA